MAKEAPSPHEKRLTPLNTNPVFSCLGENTLIDAFFRSRKNSITMNQVSSREVYVSSRYSYWIRYLWNRLKSALSIKECCQIFLKGLVLRSKNVIFQCETKISIKKKVFQTKKNKNFSFLKLRNCFFRSINLGNHNGRQWDHVSISLLCTLLT